ncbi:hypothetical protein EBR25_13490 [bacterium]|nr:hypothetical protein [bacterium]
MTRPDRLRFKPGEVVFARWHGSDEFEIVEEVACNSFLPHYKCRIWGGRKYDYWVFPQIHLSRTAIEVLIKEANSKQLSLI